VVPRASNFSSPHILEVPQLTDGAETRVPSSTGAADLEASKKLAVESNDARTKSHHAKPWQKFASNAVDLAYRIYKWGEWTDGNSDYLLQASAGAGEQAYDEVANHPWATAGLVGLGAGAVVAAPAAGLLGASTAVVAGIDSAVTAGGAIIGGGTAAYGLTSGSSEIYSAFQNKDTANAFAVLTSPDGHSASEIEEARATMRRNMGPGAFDLAMGVTGALGVFAAGPKLLELAEGVFGPVSKVSASATSLDAPSNSATLGGALPTSSETAADVARPNNAAVLIQNDGARLPDFSRGPEPVTFTQAMMYPVLQGAKSANAAREQVVQAFKDIMASKYGLIYNGDTIPEKGVLEHLGREVSAFPELADHYLLYRLQGMARSNVIEARLNQINAEHGLPPVAIYPFSGNPPWKAQYRPATMDLRVGDLAGDVTPSQLVEYIAHENEHHTHLCLAIAGFTERIAGHSPLDAEKLSAIEKAVLIDGGTPVTTDLIEAVDKFRTAAGGTGARVPLSEKEWRVFDEVNKSTKLLRRSVRLNDIVADINNVRRALDEDPTWAILEFERNLAFRFSEPPEFMTNFLGAEQTKDWPNLPLGVKVPEEPESVRTFKAAFFDFLADRQFEVEQELGDAKQQREAYRGWAHEKFAWEAGEIAKQAMSLAQALGPARLGLFKPFDLNLGDRQLTGRFFQGISVSPDDLEKLGLSP
jgi:hypothetical protein